MKQKGRKKGRRIKKNKKPPVNRPTMSRKNFQRVSTFSKQTQELKALGPGKRGKIFYTVPKTEVNVKVGDIIRESDGLYKVTRIRRPSCGAVKNCTVLCDAFDPKTVGSKQVLVPKKV